MRCPDDRHSARSALHGSTLNTQLDKAKHGQRPLRKEGAIMKTLVGALTVGAALIVATAFMQAADAQQFRPRPDDKGRLR